VNVPLEHPPARVAGRHRHHFADGIGEDSQHFRPFGARDVGPGEYRAGLRLPRVIHPAAHRQDPGAD
jgi:hypothetical protein